MSTKITLSLASALSITITFIVGTVSYWLLPYTPTQSEILYLLGSTLIGSFTLSLLFLASLHFIAEYVLDSVLYNTDKLEDLIRELKDSKADKEIDKLLSSSSSCPSDSNISNTIIEHINDSIEDSTKILQDYISSLLITNVDSEPIPEYLNFNDEFKFLDSFNKEIKDITLEDSEPSDKAITDVIQEAYEQHDKGNIVNASSIEGLLKYESLLFLGDKIRIKTIDTTVLTIAKNSVSTPLIIGKKFDYILY